MPLYTYYCPKCDKSKEYFSSIAERDEPKHCAECDNALFRMIDRPGMVWSPTSTGGSHKV
jgi:putative FmdB family regulatory protein